MQAMNRLAAVAAAVILGGLAVNSSQASFQYHEWTGAPNAVDTLSETSPGTYSFTEGYTWRDENGGGHTEDDLGTWASRTWSYRAYQYDGIGNTILMETSSPQQYIEYKFVIPVDISNLGAVTVAADIRGSSVVARALNVSTNSYYTNQSLFSGGSGFDPMSNTVPASALDSSVNGQVSFMLQVAQEGSGNATGLDSLSITATAVPEPASALMIGIGSALFLRRRRAR